jgi:NFU1 iron-sulfur cluster scaffold homolog, mitochondrial
MTKFAHSTDMMIYTEITPNPAALRFVVMEKPLVSAQGYDFPNVQEAVKSPLAEKIFGFKFTKGVYIGQNFVTLTREDGFTWEEIIPQVKGLMKSFLENGEHVLAFAETTEEATADGIEDDEVVKKIKSLLDANIRPAVAMDGGDVLFDSFENGVVKLKMKGSCSGCPSSTMTLKMGIEGLLTRMVPEVKQVEAVE